MEIQIQKILIFIFIPYLANCAFALNTKDLDTVVLQKIQISANSTNTRFVGAFSIFHISDIKVSWRNALIICTSRGLRLVTITSPYIDNNVATLLSTTGSFAVWTAGNDLKFLSSFVWETTGAYITYSNWRNGPPVNSKFKGCISVANKGACSRPGNYGWDKLDCETLAYAMCE